MDRVAFSNLDKVYWPKEGYTKGDLIHYYEEISPHILPYLKDRPQSLHRHPEGIYGESFYQKNMTGKMPEFLKIIEIAVGDGGKKINAPLCQNIESLMYLVNLGCIEMNPWNSRIKNLDRPDYLVIDIDPNGVDFSHVIRVAKITHSLLEKIKVPSYCKTSGKTGLHIYIPLNARYTHHQSKQLGELLAKLIHIQYPEYTSVQRIPNKRKKKIYIDYLQNRVGQTLAAPYSVRPCSGATVSTPLQWGEVKTGLCPQQFTMMNMLARIKKVGDLWCPVVKKGIDLEDALDLLHKMHGGIFK